VWNQRGLLQEKEGEHQQEIDDNIVDDDGDDDGDDEERRLPGRAETGTVSLQKKERVVHASNKPKKPILVKYAAHYFPDITTFGYRVIYDLLANTFLISTPLASRNDPRVVAEFVQVKEAKLVVTRLLSG
jgi:hypothetical protein